MADISTKLKQLRALYINLHEVEGKAVANKIAKLEAMLLKESDLKKTADISTKIKQLHALLTMQGKKAVANKIAKLEAMLLKESDLCSLKCSPTVNNEIILRELYEADTREIRPDELRPLKFNFEELYTSQSVAFGVIIIYFWKDVKYGGYLLERVEKTHQTEDDNPKYFIKKIEKDDDSPDENDMNIIKEFLLNSEDRSYSTCKRYLKKYPDTLLKWFQINKTQGGDDVAQWVSWTELSLEEIDNA
tara:strand:- start:449 stop:1189 length:741 start_codon:yes stop_codon:yes gene_type:complete